MWRVGRAPTVLLAIFLTPAIACPAAWASPEGESIQQYGQPPVWGGCEQFIGDVGAIHSAQCGTVSVPVDYAKPEGAQAQLAVIRIPASGDRMGVLVVNPGGPGASAVDTVASMGASLADSDILRRFDLVGIDPRGVGHSTPELRCRTDAEFDAFRREPMADYSSEGVAHIEAINTQFARSCADRMGTEFLANIGTASSARDMDVVRAALGENQIN
jgi:pimeloyl-ACP methyl ester carboxylesterase